MDLFDHHVHSDRSDGTVSLADRAKSVAIRPHGVSDHYPWRGKLQSDDDILRYLEDASRLGLRVGLEYDLGVAPPLLPSTRRALHYVIGAIHQVRVEGGWVRYDAAGDFLKGRAGAAYGERARFDDPELQRAVREEILRVVRQGIERDRIDILGHPTFSPLAALGDPETAYPEEWQERLIELCVGAGVAIEVNESYGVPHRAFLVRAHRAGALFAVGSDTHFELRPLDRTALMIEGAGLPDERFLAAPGADQAARSSARSS